MYTCPGFVSFHMSAVEFIHVYRSFNKGYSFLLSSMNYIVLLYLFLSCFSRTCGLLLSRSVSVIVIASEFEMMLKTKNTLNDPKCSV